MSYYYNVLARKIERQKENPKATKEELIQNVALWQAYNLLSAEEFMSLMEKIEEVYPEVVEPEVDEETVEE